MQYVLVSADERWLGQCAHCGGLATEKDHAIPRVFMDPPLPDQVPVVSSCAKCNRGASQDEQYVACLLDVIISQSCDPARVSREKVRQMLQEKPLLRARFTDDAFLARPIRAVPAAGQPSFFGVEEDRMARVLLKMCRGLAAYELAARFLEQPTYFAAFTREMTTPEELAAFEEEPGLRNAYDPSLYELGSAAFNRQLVVLDDRGVAQVWGPGWQDVQDGRCRYMVVAQSSVVSVRLVLSEYLYVSAAWANGGVGETLEAEREGT